MSLKKIGIICLCAVMLLTGCSAGSGNTSKTDDDTKTVKKVFAMDTYMTITCYGEKSEEAADAAVSEIERLDDLLSVGNPESEISVINEKGSGSVSSDTMDMIKKAIEVWDETDGAFDITIYPLMVEWGFTSGDFNVPDEKSINELLKYVDSGQIKVDDDNMTVSIGESQGIDLGGIAKGFTSDRLMEIFEEYGLTSASVSLGGNAQCYNTKPDGSSWKCAIVDPNSPDSSESYLGIIELEDQAAITSGAYERNFTDEETGKMYHHILDPSTGYPANSGLISATVVSKSGILADALSTSCYVMGLDKSIEFWENNREDFDLILMTEDNTVYVTEGIKDHFSTEYSMVVVD